MYNPGDILRFQGKNADQDEFALYDEFFPRRKIMLDPTANVLESFVENNTFDGSNDGFVLVDSEKLILPDHGFETGQAVPGPLAFSQRDGRAVRGSGPTAVGSRHRLRRAPRGRAASAGPGPY